MIPTAVCIFGVGVGEAVTIVVMIVGEAVIVDVLRIRIRESENPRFHGS